MNGNSNGKREWRKVAFVVAGSLAASVLIAFGAVRFLDQAQREHDRVTAMADQVQRESNRIECVRREMQGQARGTVVMGYVVLNANASQDQRRAAFDRWVREQGDVADRIGRC